MRKSVSLVLVTAIFLVLLTQSANAGGGRFLLYQKASNPWNVKQGVITSQVFIDGALSGFSSGERVEFRIKNPQANDRCVNGSEKTNETGVIWATCYADSARQMEVYVHSLDKGDESSIAILNFIDPPTPTLVPTRVPTRVPTYSPTPTVSSPSLEPTETPIPSPVPTSNNHVDRSSFFLIRWIYKVIDFFSDWLNSNNLLLSDHRDTAL